MSTIRDYVMAHDLFCHHDHHCTFEYLHAHRQEFDYRSLLGYAEADLVAAAGARPEGPIDQQYLARLWPTIRVTGYGQAVAMGCKALFGLDYAPKNFCAITEALQESLEGKSARDVFDYFVYGQARNRWTIQDGHMWVVTQPGFENRWDAEGFLPSYRFAVRMDPLFDMVDAQPIAELEALTNVSVHTVSDLVTALNRSIDLCQQAGKVAALKVGMAYRRDLVVSDPTHHEAELAFNRIRSRKVFWDGVQQNTGAVDATASRKLGDYLFHQLMRRADEENLPVQIHTGYLAGSWGSLAGTKALHLIPILEKYRRVRFDLFHASWPWTSELGAIGKNYPNVWLDMCWAWTMNPGQSARALGEWLDAVPFNKIFAYGADTMLPWCNVGYSLQAKRGIARVLEAKVAAGVYSERTAQEIADCIMLRNGEEFFGLA